MPPEALTGMMHGHKHLGYLLALLPIIQLILIFAGATKKPGLAKAVRLIAKIGYNALGGIVILLGLALWFTLGYGLTTGFAWLGLVLWAPVAVTAKRMVVPHCEAVMNGDTGEGKMMVGTIVQLVAIVTIVGLMTVKPF